MKIIQQLINIGEGGIWPTLLASLLIFDAYMISMINSLGEITEGITRINTNFYDLGQNMTVLMINTGNILKLTGSIDQLTRDIEIHTKETEKHTDAIEKHTEDSADELAAILIAITRTNSLLASMETQLIETGALTEVINEAIVTGNEVSIQNAKANADAAAELLGTNTRWETLEATLGTIEGTLDAILAKIPLGSLLARLNAEVTSIEYANRDAVQWDGDFCENDPFGIGPINCEGIEEEGGTINGLTFL